MQSVTRASPREQGKVLQQRTSGPATGQRSSRIEESIGRIVAAAELRGRGLTPAVGLTPGVSGTFRCLDDRLFKG
jgi:hypothetical protein